MLQETERMTEANSKLRPLLSIIAKKCVRKNLAGKNVYNLVQKSVDYEMSIEL